MEEKKNSPPLPNDFQQKEEQLNTTSTDETIAASETIADVEQPRPTEPTGQASTLNLSAEALANADLKPSTLEEMEVHHHSHESHGKKNWKSYFWEFLMLFLAVSLGFYAENTREVILHKKEVKTQLNSMLSDLQSDISLFDSVTDRNSYGAQMADSLIEMLHLDIKNTSKIYFAARTVTANLGYYYTNSKSFDQLKTAGLLRYIKSKELLDSIGVYYVSFQWLANQIDLLRLKLDEIHKGNALLFDSYVFQQMISAGIFGSISLGGQRTTINKLDVNPYLLSTDTKDLNTVSLNYHYYSATIKFYIRNATAIQNRAKSLIEMINKEYPQE